MTEEKKPFDPVAYKDQFNEDHYDRVYVRIAKGEKIRLKIHAQTQGESLNEFINRAITEQIHRDKYGNKDEDIEKVLDFISEDTFSFPNDTEE